ALYLPMAWVMVTGDGGDGNVNDVIPVVDKTEELAQEYMEHGKRSRFKKT
ncbi:hypothetical protein Tco_1331636, partial [Tanacetum coccineum]